MRIPRRALFAWAAGLLVGCNGGGDDGAVVTISTPATSNLLTTPTVAPTPAPPPEIVTSADTIFQAGASIVSVVGDLSGGSITFLNRTYQLTKGARSYYAVVPADADDPAGTHPMKVDFVLKNGSKGSMPYQLTIRRTAWTVDSITVGPQLAPLLDPKVQAAELAMLKGIYSQYTPEKLWDGSWALPIGGDVTTRFGEERSYNGAPVSGHHSGTDLGAASGTPVGATNSGRVAMARQVQLRGNMVILDHGGGLFSGYAHLSSFAVAEGEMVRQGDPLGFVGSTGLSTGAHLYWEMSAGAILVDPYRFTDGTNGF